MYSKFNIDEDTIKQLKTIGNIFVKKHNEFCKDIENEQTDLSYNS